MMRETCNNFSVINRQYIHLCTATYRITMSSLMLQIREERVTSRIL